MENVNNLIENHANLYAHICKYNPVIYFTDCPPEISRVINEYVTSQLLIDFLTMFAIVPNKLPYRQFLADMAMYTLVDKSAYPMMMPHYFTPFLLTALSKDNNPTRFDFDLFLAKLLQPNPQLDDDFKRMIAAIRLDVSDYQSMPPTLMSYERDCDRGFVEPRLLNQHDLYYISLYGGWITQLRSAAFSTNTNKSYK